MHDASFVSGIERRGDLPRNRQDLLEWQGLAGRPRLLMRLESISPSMSSMMSARVSAWSSSPWMVAILG